MKRACLILGLLLAPAPGIAIASDLGPPPMPEWQTEPGRCTWKWQQAGEIGLWTQVCKLSTGTWRIKWDRQRHAFVEQLDRKMTRIVVQVWPLAPNSGVDTLTTSLAAAGKLDANAGCRLVQVSHRASPRTVAFFMLSPSDEKSLEPTASGEVPEPTCGQYGRSTHGVRYFMTDTRWPDRALFVDEGQERPMFDPGSITLTPRPRTAR